MLKKSLHLAALVAIFCIPSLTARISQDTDTCFLSVILSVLFGGVYLLTFGNKLLGRME